MSHYLPDISILFYLAMATGIIAALFMLGMLLGAMIQFGHEDKHSRGLLAPFGDFARWLTNHPVFIVSFALGWMLVEWWKS